MPYPYQAHPVVLEWLGLLLLAMLLVYAHQDT
jgi:hypothetical protein